MSALSGKSEGILALAKPRRITVKGKEYHWKTSTNGKFHLVIVDPENNSRKIVVQYDKEKTITPKHVRYRIENAPKIWNNEIKICVDNG